MTAPAAAVVGCWVKTRLAPTPPTFVKLKLADGVTPVTDAVTGYAPTVVFATADTLAWPFASVATIDAERLADAPVVGAVNVTSTLLRGLLKESVTSACNGTANGASTVALCGVPATAAIIAGAPAKIVKELLCVEASAGAEAVS
jgi:hypothetical protein